ncbi:nucleotide-binding protein [Aeromonas caviae]|uniref:TIR domain-containing protein n=1 Tax=Aeromonas caviae TaxID=648 RepID=UPI00191F1193|nr:TIR domain-containing protein [Aeromonas caviae]MBL0439820.1 nucleotide-binding protein [Aeromonas caviae]
MRRIIFYSWQSDIPSRLNRNIIEDALNRALKAIRRDETESLEPVLDRDTSGVPGSPSISDTIFKKISSADIFVADVTIINKNSDNKKTPNPNVLIELGFAISQLGWDRIILIQNSQEGANKRRNSSRLTQSFHFFMFEPIFSPVNALNQPI